MNLLNLSNICLLLDFLSPIIGLVGAVLVYYYVIPFKLDVTLPPVSLSGSRSGGHSFSKSRSRKDEENEKEILKFKKFASLGLTLIIFSFVIQILNLVLKLFN